MKYYIFDWDGVIADSFNACNRAKIDMGDVQTLDEAALSTLNYSNQKNLHTRGGNEEDINDANQWTARYAQFIMKEEIPFFDGFVSEISKVKDAKFAIVSSGPGIVVRKMLRDLDIDFTHVLCYEDHHSKEEKVEHVCSDWGIKIGDVCYFTDTKTDVWELSEIMNKKNIFGCSWGFSGIEELRKVLPEKQILTDFSDIHKISKKNIKD